MSKEPNLSNCLLQVGDRLDKFMHYSITLVWRETQTAFSWIWTREADFISNGDNCYA